MKNGWKSLTEYLTENTVQNKGNRAYYLSRIPPQFRQKDRDGHWEVSAKCPPLSSLNHAKKETK